MLMENAIKHTKDVFIHFLRLYFHNPKNYERKLPPQISNDAFVHSEFYATEPQELRNFPTVILTAGSGNMITSGLGDFSNPIVDPRTHQTIAYRYQGFYEFAITIDIGCRNPLEREVFTDFLAKALRFHLRRYIQNQGIIIKDCSYAGEAVYEYNSDRIYTSQLRFNTWSTWVEDVSLLDPSEFDLELSMHVVYGSDSDKETLSSATIASFDKNYNDNGENDEDVIKTDNIFMEDN